MKQSSSRQYTLLVPQALKLLNVMASDKSSPFLWGPVIIPALSHTNWFRSTHTICLQSNIPHIGSFKK